VNLTDQWQSYILGDGDINIEIVDEGVDSNQTTIDVDFLAVRVLAEGVQFSFHNEGASTCHVVSIWVINSTVHERYEADVFVNSGERLNYTRMNMVLPTSSYLVKAVTERGNIAVYSAN
jgi:hypothetical protein